MHKCGLVLAVEQTDSSNLSYFDSELRISFEANSKNNDEFAIFKAFRLALLNEAAVPSGVLASIPPTFEK